MIHKQFSRFLLRWFKVHGRHTLPWQLNQTPYSILVSEVMLQQTQVSTVIPYYERFMHAFPTAQTLAEADFEHVQHLWTGLGYYRRARYLHETAKTITTVFNGIVPDCLETLQTLKGIGRSTAGAILAAAYHKRGVILDGNVKRVLARVFGLSDPVNTTNHANAFWALADQLTPSKDTADYNQAMMDLGATVCKLTRPLCDRCPMQTMCTAYEQNRIDELPARQTKRAIPTRETAFIMLQHKHSVLLIKRESRGVWQDLWSFPEYTGTLNQKKLAAHVREQFGLQIKTIEPLEKIRHQFSHYRLTIHPVRIAVQSLKKTANNELAQNDAIWYNMKKPVKIGLPKPVAALLELLSP